MQKRTDQSRARFPLGPVCHPVLPPRPIPASSGLPGPARGGGVEGWGIPCDAARKGLRRRRGQLSLSRAPRYSRGSGTAARWGCR